MSIKSKIVMTIRRHPRFVAGCLDVMGPLFNERVYLKLLFKLRMGEELDLDNPLTFNQKLQWLKLYNRKPEYTMMVDKYLVKQYVADKIGPEYVIPTLGIWDRPEDIEWDKLPNQFVLKNTAGGGGKGVIICRDKLTFNRKEAVRHLKKSMRVDGYRLLIEWPYKDVPKRIIAEKYMTELDGNELQDFKIHNFNGNPKVILVCRDRFKNTGLTEDFFTVKWEHLNVRRPGHPNASELIDKPKELETMLRISEILAKDCPFMRTDFYIVGEKVYFGEITFFPASGIEKLVPRSYDVLFGSWISIPIENTVSD